MKFLAVILSIYVLTLNMMPCSDDGNLHDDTSITSLIDFDGDHDEDCELCSPFCHCHCCHTHAIGVLNLYSKIPSQTIDDEVSSAECEFVQDVSFRFFQPPRNIG